MPFLRRTDSVALLPTPSTRVFQRLPPPRSQKSCPSSPRLRTTNFTAPDLGRADSEIRPSTSLTRIVCAAPEPNVGTASAIIAIAEASRTPIVFFIDSSFSWSPAARVRAGAVLVVVVVVVVAAALVVVAVVLVVPTPIAAAAVVLAGLCARAPRIVGVLGLVARAADVLGLRLVRRRAESRRLVRGGRLSGGGGLTDRGRHPVVRGRVRERSAGERTSCRKQHEHGQADNELAHVSSFAHEDRLAGVRPTAGKLRLRERKALVKP